MKLDMSALIAEGKSLRDARSELGYHALQRKS